ncbi:hypothetical protein BDQ12DRAFT_663429 [Crucibulum laeve]|uniref:Uncharacterized protein n=1 Tax=Crucibulum laeve TaxID=68775 RepID=A0A5C3MA88_9AGAR|nr:hypothetical protein BDQ12DRAFT_663429 [Crucibulum laeve]
MAEPKKHKPFIALIQIEQGIIEAYICMVGDISNNMRRNGRIEGWDQSRNTTSERFYVEVQRFSKMGSQRHTKENNVGSKWLTVDGVEDGDMATHGAKSGCTYFEKEEQEWENKWNERRKDVLQDWGYSVIAGNGCVGVVDVSKWRGYNEVKGCYGIGEKMKSKQRGGENRGEGMRGELNVDEGRVPGHLDHVKENIGISLEAISKLMRMDKGSVKR